MAKAKEPKAPKEKKPKAAKSKSGGGGLRALLLKKGEWIALGGATACLVILLLWGVKQGAKAVNPEKESSEMVRNAKGIQDTIQSGKLTESDVPEVPAWIKDTAPPKAVLVSDFPVTGPLFDITARPDTKRDNPVVLGIEDFQFDLIKAPMKAYDIRQTATGYSIAVRITKTTLALDPQKVKEAKEALIRRLNNNRGGRGQIAVGAALQPPPGPQPPPGGAQPPGGSVQPPGGMMGSGGPMGSGGGSPFGFGGGGTSFDPNAARTETVIEYVPLESLDTAIAAGKVPAATVVPLRMILVHATIPLKKQIEEIKRALRLKDTLGVDPTYDGYEIQRKETGPRGVVVDWPAGADALKPNLDFEANYIDLIASRKLADHFDPNLGGQNEFLPYYLRYEQALVLPLPELVTELGAYPQVRIPLITDAIQKMIEARRPPISASELAQRMSGKLSRPGLYTPTTSAGATSLGSGEGIMAPSGMGGPRGPGGPMGPMGAAMGPMGAPPPGGPRGLGAGGPPGAGGAAQPLEVENLLLRFIDCDVKPGHTYEYRIQLKMKSPNFGPQFKNMVLNPAWATDAKFETLRSPWVTINTPITVPQENFLFAYDPETYRKSVEETYKGPTMARLKSRFQVKDNQAVVQVQQWRQEVRTGDKREPVGAWIVTEMPVGRGEYIGRKQYVRLPLWSSEANNYVLREIPDKIFKGEKSEQPKGWLVDFSDQSVLVDFEGGRVQALVGGRRVDDDVAEELLILGRDGRLLVRSSLADENDPNRKAYTGIWERWQKGAETRKSPTTGGAAGEFDGGGRPGGKN